MESSSSQAPETFNRFIEDSFLFRGGGGWVFRVLGAGSRVLGLGIGALRSEPNGGDQERPCVSSLGAFNIIILETVPPQTLPLFVTTVAPWD